MGKDIIKKKTEEDLEILRVKYLDLLEQQKFYINKTEGLHKKEIEKLTKKIDLLNRKITLLNSEVAEYRGFKKSKIWKTLEIYRKVKKNLISNYERLWKDIRKK